MPNLKLPTAVGKHLPSHGLFFWGGGANVSCSDYMPHGNTFKTAYPFARESQSSYIFQIILVFGMAKAQFPGHNAVNGLVFSNVLAQRLTIFIFLVHYSITFPISVTEMAMIHIHML